jgi:hypothetical protein
MKLRLILLLALASILHAAPTDKIVLSELPPVTVSETPSMADLRRKYAKAFASATVGSGAMVARFLREDLARDRARFAAIADTNRPTGKGRVEMTAAKAIVRWLDGPVAKAITKLETLSTP